MENNIREIEMIKPRYYTILQIQQLEGCGRDRAYEIAHMLPHEIRGEKKRKIFVLAEAYEEYFQKNRERILKEFKEKKEAEKEERKIYHIRKFS